MIFTSLLSLQEVEDIKKSFCYFSMDRLYHILQQLSQKHGKDSIWLMKIKVIRKMERIHEHDNKQFENDDEVKYSENSVGCEDDNDEDDDDYNNNN